MESGFSLHVNPRYLADPGADTGLASTISSEGRAAARAVLTRFSGYRPTPLHGLPAMARSLGIGSLWLKDEGGRFGLGSFKALGGAYAVAALLADELGEPQSVGDVFDGRAADRVAAFTVCCATDGNHGRAVAWGARCAGARCVVFLPGHVSANRAASIASLGAEVVHVSGIYDDALRACARAAEEKGWFLVSDTSYAGGDETPTRVMHGYTVMVDEAVAALSGTRPTHLFVQGGVGGLAASVIGAFRQDLGTSSPKGVVVEPAAADCLYQSARQGRPAPASGDLETVMGCLSAAEISPLAWRALERGAFAFMTLADDGAVAAMRRAAEPQEDDPAIVLGESGAAALGGLLAVAADAEARGALGLGAESRVLVMGSEGATDPALYRQLVGRDPEAVTAAARNGRTG